LVKKDEGGWGLTEGYKEKEKRLQGKGYHFNTENRVVGIIKEYLKSKSNPLINSEFTKYLY
jgi:hypothetical protein